jgi:hypothetical protein
MHIEIEMSLQDSFIKSVCYNNAFCICSLQLFFVVAGWGAVLYNRGSCGHNID